MDTTTLISYGPFIVVLPIVALVVIGLLIRKRGDRRRQNQSSRQHSTRR